MFCRCTALETVDLSDKVTEIGEKAFWECTDLKTVDGFDAVSTIGREAFQGCSSLEYHPGAAGDHAL
jgi:limonene-1,2-epoxide hydrolase